MSSPKTVTSFGLGAMGAALAHSIQNAGIELTVWNRNPERESIKGLVEGGATHARDVSAALKASELSLICLLDYASVYETFEKADKDAFKDKIIVNLTTANSEEGPKMDKWMKERGVKYYFDGAIMYVPQHVGTDHAFTYVAGETQEAFRSVEPAIRSTGAWDYVGGDTSSSAIHDNAILAGMYGMFGGCLTAIALLSKAKPPRATAEVIKTQLLPALHSLSEWVEEAAGCYDKKDWGGYTATNEVNAHAMVNVMKSCAVEGIDTRCLEGSHALFDRAVKDGKGPNGMAWCVGYLFEGKK